MKAHASLLQQPASPAIKSLAGQGNPVPSPRAGFWGRLVARVSSWFEIPYGYQDENGFHYGKPPPPVFTDRAHDAMTYPMVLPKLSSEDPDQSPAPPPLAASVAKD